MKFLLKPKKFLIDELESDAFEQDDRFKLDREFMKKSKV